LQEAKAKLEAANADVKLKDALIGVVQKDRDKAQAQADYSQVTSLFDGHIKHRHADPVSFVRIGDLVLTVERTDIVTVIMKVPDTFAPLVFEETEAIIEMSGLPGLAIQGRVTRFSPSLETKANDRTMLVEVDLFNGTEREYERFLGRERAKKVPFEDLKEGPLPLVPKVTGPNAGEFHRLLPGMYGEMRLVFRKLADDYLVPSDAIVMDGGTPYLFLAQDGKAHRVQVEIQVDDQKLAKVTLLEKTGDGQVKRSLTEKDVIIYSNLGELTDGEPVSPISVDWQP